jgi:hypothetical protein
MHAFFRNMNGNPAGIPAFHSLSGIRYWVPGAGSWYLGPDTRAGSTPRAGYRTPRTELNTHTGLHPVSRILYLVYPMGVFFEA